MVRLRVWPIVAAIVIVWRSLALALEPAPATNDDPRSQSNSFGRMIHAFGQLLEISQGQQYRGTQQDDKQTECTC